MFELFIGDVSQLLADEATKHDKDAVLITLSNVDNFLKTPTGTAYSSIGDIENLDIFLQLCSKADKIYYRPPKSWSTIDSSNKEKQFTEIIIAGLSQYIPVDGVQKIIDQTQYFHDNFLKDTNILLIGTIISQIIVIATVPILSRIFTYPNAQILVN